jgi:hypothetical protein
MEILNLGGMVFKMDIIERLTFKNEQVDNI